MADQIKVLLFAQFKERLGCGEIMWDASPNLTLDGLKQQLLAQSEQWQSALEGQCLMALNQTVSQGQTPVNAGDEVALFPPVTGG